MNILRILADGLILSGMTIGASLQGSPFVLNKNSLEAASFNKKRLYLIYIAGLIFTVLEVYFIYRGQENSDLFFWHPYFSWTIANAAYTLWKLREKRDALRNVASFLLHRLLLWQFVVNTVFAGFALSVGWIMKLYIR